MSIRELNYLKIFETKFAKTDFEQKSKKINLFQVKICT